MKKWPVERQILAGFSLALVLLLVMGFLVWNSSQRLVEAHRAVERGQKALTTLQTMLALMSQAEAEQRLYYFTNNDTDLRLRESAVARINELTAELKQLLADDPATLGLMPELQKRVADRLRLLDLVLEERRRGGLEEMRRQLLRTPGRTEMQQLQAILERMQSSVLVRLDRRDQTARADANRAAMFVALLLILSGTAASLLYFRIRREIRERQHAEDALKRHMEELQNSENRLRAVVDTAIDGIIVINERGIVDRFNRAAEKLFGYVSEEVIGKNISMLMPSPDSERHDDYLARYLHGGKPRIIGIGREVTAKRKNGTLFPMDLAVSEMRVGGQRMFTGIVRDITERKHAETQRAQLIAELQSTNEELMNFAYVVSHDLKAPLRAIGSLTDWLITDYREKLDADGQEHLRLLKSRVRRMDGLIDGILEYSRIGRVKENLTVVDTNITVKEALHLLAPPPHISVVVEGPLPVITADPTRIQQVFQNLLSNAIKYIDKPQGIIRISCQSHADMWQFSIADNGPGIEPRHHERIFQLFQTLAPRDRVESTGVGLTLVKKIIELYGGRIWLESVPGQGTTFLFTLPRKAAKVQVMEGSVQ